MPAFYCKYCGVPNHPKIDCKTATYHYYMKNLDNITVIKPKPPRQAGRI